MLGQQVLGTVAAGNAEHERRWAAGLFHHRWKLGSATSASSGRGTIQRHWDPRQRLGQGISI